MYIYIHSTCTYTCMCVMVMLHVMTHVHVSLSGHLKPGGTVVEGTAGNTGIGLAHICKALGYKCVIYMPDTQSQVHCIYIAHTCTHACACLMRIQHAQAHVP